ncbi:MAG: hypothetical protein CMO80_19020 [Verrucomicrobiales bacterium]|nr:hypothetical protein [Verrucomicrobiales bacterium]|tara:strand:+ start:2382 stop:4037 length:1656 start_codon:yes stop_codon:yes gene_type:complete
MRFLLCIGISIVFIIIQARGAELIGHWKLTEDIKDSSGRRHQAINQGVTVSEHGAKFDGRRSRLEINTPPLNLGAKPFSISVWVYTAEKLNDVLGDILSHYDAQSRTGFNLGIQNFAGVASSQSNYRHLYFGIDDGRIDEKWTDCGRPGESLFAYGMCTYRGALYVGSFEAGAGQSGHVYRYAGGTNWVDLGAPDRCNAVQSLAVFDGNLYAGVTRYEAGGSAMKRSPNLHDGGTVYRYADGKQWIDCGKLKNEETGEAFAVGGMAVFNGRLYAGVTKKPGKGLYRYEGGKRWTYCGNPDRRVVFPAVHNGAMYLASLDRAHVNRYDGDGKWTYVGVPIGATQTYGFAIHRGELYTSTWPEGKVFRHGGGTNWINAGRLGTEKEVMGMLVYNGKMYAGTLPLAEVHRYDGDHRWTNTGQLDTTPDVKYRRAWSMAVHQGKLYCGTLPSGRIYSLEAGKCVTYDHALPAGWKHLTAVRSDKDLKLYVNGSLVAQTSLGRSSFDLSNDQPLLIGSGPNDSFNGMMRDLRIYRGALVQEEVSKLSGMWPFLRSP